MWENPATVIERAPKKAQSPTANPPVEQSDKTVPDDLPKTGEFRLQHEALRKYHLRFQQVQKFRLV